MNILKQERAELQAASVSMAIALCDAGYISDKDKRWLIYRINTGDKTAYKDLRDLLLEVSEELTEK